MGLKFEYDTIPAVKTTSGMVKGYCFDGVYTFKGIPYAYADRFQMPVEYQKWEGVKDTTSYGHVCPLMFPDNPTGEMMVPHMYWPENEHCQYLNIWTNELNPKAKKPVMVWLHGGGFFAGSSIEQLAYDGMNMSQSDVVVVSLNHRLNILGFMDLSWYDDKYKNSANVGLADIVAALEWVKKNIVEFGGDPDNVTLFGQSGGGMKITALMQIPSAQGLFHKGIVMSGVAGHFMKPCDGGNGKAIVTALLKQLKLKEVEQLETVPYATLAQAYMIVSGDVAKKGDYIGNNPMINDYYLGEPHMTKFTQQAKQTPLIVGTVFGEFGGFAPKPYNKSQLNHQEMMVIIEKTFGDKTAAIVHAFQTAYPDKKIIDLLDLDALFRPLSKELVCAKAKYKEAPTYSYLFSLNFPCHHGQTAWHCSDIPFVFHNIDKVPVANIEGISDELQEKMFNAFISFAKTGNPNHKELPQWDACTPEKEVTMLFDQECRIGINFDDEVLKLLKDVLPEITAEMILESATNIQH